MGGLTLCPSPCDLLGLFAEGGSSQLVALRLRRCPVVPETLHSGERRVGCCHSFRSVFSLKLCLFFLTVLCGLRDLSFPIRDQARAPCNGSTEH